MSTSRAILTVTFFAASIACRDTAAPTSPDLTLAAAHGASGLVATVNIEDACDPVTFAG